MSNNKWNSEQEQAINTRNSNLLISAGAGSGKTTVLTERIIKLIEEGNSILDFVVCTFTEDATKSMKNKISNALLSRGMEEEAALVHIADISTIHSLCRRIISDNFDKVSLPPKFSILSDGDILMDSALDLALETLYEDENFVAFATKFSPRDNKVIKEMLKETYKFLTNMPDYKEYVAKQINAYENSDFSQTKQAYINIKLQDLYNHKKSFDILAHTPGLTDKENDLIASDIGALNESIDILRGGSIDLSCISFKNMPQKQPNKDYITKFRKPLKEKIDEIKKFNEILEKPEVFKPIAEDIKMLFKGVLTFDEIFFAQKMKRLLLTYNDLEQYAYKILQDETVAKEYKKRYKFIFVDEYQDTSKIQQAILDRMVGEDNLFMVGDIKQSIYAFRHANPSMFHNRYLAYAKGDGGTKIDLYKNYRSGENILFFANDIFSSLLNIYNNYYPKEACLATDVHKDNHIPVEIDYAFGKDKATAEAVRIADRIEECVKNGYSYGDIAVLYKSVKCDEAVSLYRLLNDKKIPVSISDDDNGIFMETRTFINYLMLIDNIDNDIPLLSVMYSSLGRFTISDIIAVNATDKKSFYQRLTAYKGDPALEKKISDFLSTVEEFAVKALELSTDELISAVLAHTGYLKLLETGRDPQAKTSQIYKLINIAKAYEEQGNFGLSDFLAYYEKLKDLDKTFEGGGFVQSNDAVSIMTMHKSKGLEFPVVIIGGINKKLYRTQDEIIFAFNEVFGVGLYLLNNKRFAKIETPQITVIKALNRISGFEEAMRLLYVAVTRPMERLFIVGGFESAKKDNCKSIADEPFTGETKKLLSGSCTYFDCLSFAFADLKDGTSAYNINYIDMDTKNLPAPTVIEPLANKEITRILSTDINLEPVAVPKKTAVTTITKEEKPFIAYRTVAPKKSDNGAKAGTVAHNLLYHLRKDDSFDTLVARMDEGGYFTKEERALFNREMIEAFINSPLKKRMFSAKKLYREKPFMLPIDEKSGFCNETVMVQGIMDCVFEEDDGLVLVDYKTDNVIKNAENILKENYSKQLSLYAYALKQLTGKTVKGAYIYHLKTNKIIEINL